MLNPMRYIKNKTDTVYIANAVVSDEPGENYAHLIEAGSLKQLTQSFQCVVMEVFHPF